jgi:phage terminase large subunit-like protein
MADSVATGIDAGGLNDLFASVDVAKFACGIDDDGKQDWRYEVRCRAYIDADTERDLTEEPWNTWVYTDELRVVSALFKSVFDDTTAAMWGSRIPIVGFDPLMMQQMGEQFAEQGFEAVKIAQTRYNYHQPLTLLMDLVRKKLITHDGHPVLRFAIKNLAVNSDSSNRWMPDRKSSKEKIDPAVAMLMALRLASLAKKRSQGSFFVS